MRIREIHKNGAQIEVSGLFGVHKAVRQWRQDQNSLVDPPEEKLPVGFSPH